MTAEDIYRQLLEHGDEIGLATVYRVLTQFEPPASCSLISRAARRSRTGPWRPP